MWNALLRIYPRGAAAATVSRTAGAADLPSPAPVLDERPLHDSCFAANLDGKRGPRSRPLPGIARRVSAAADGGAPSLRFLSTCGTCFCTLHPGCDIYIYKGDAAFCSDECRELRIRGEARWPSN